MNPGGISPDFQVALRETSRAQRTGRWQWESDLPNDIYDGDFD